MVLVLHCADTDACKPISVPLTPGVNPCSAKPAVSKSAQLSQPLPLKDAGFEISGGP